MKNIPTPNSFVKVTAKYRNIRYDSDSPFYYVTQKGKVIKSPKWVPADCFSIETDNPDFPISVINMKYVDSIDYISGNSCEVKKVDVGKYIVLQNGNSYSCNCIGFKYHSKCKHITSVKEIV